MTYEEGIDSLINTAEDFKYVIEKLQEENAFLADTIEKHNLEEIVSERRALLAANKNAKEEALRISLSKNFEK